MKICLQECIIIWRLPQVAGLFFSQLMSCNEYLLIFLFCPHHMAKLLYYKTQNIIWNFISRPDIIDWYGQREITLKNVKVISQHEPLRLERFYTYFVDLIDDIGDHMDQTKERLVKETRHIRIVDRKSATCGTLIISSLLVHSTCTISEKHCSGFVLYQYKLPQNSLLQPLFNYLNSVNVKRFWTSTSIQSEAKWLRMKI